jgi:hypothetical protein
MGLGILLLHAGSQPFNDRRTYGMGKTHPMDAVMTTYPSKGLSLRMAEIAHERKDEKAMWTWLITWAFHEMYLQEWYGIEPDTTTS